MNFFSYHLLALLLAFIFERCVCLDRPYQKIQKKPLFYKLLPLFNFWVATGFWFFIPWPFLSLVLYALTGLALLLISNAKVAILRAPYVTQDSENLRHILLYPDFYLKPLGWLCMGAALVFLLAFSYFLAGLGAPQALVYPAHPFLAWLFTIALFIAASVFSAKLLRHYFTLDRLKSLDFKGLESCDTAHFGLLTSLFFQAFSTSHKAHLAELEGPYQDLIAPVEKPHIIAIQGESFFNLARFEEKATQSPHELKNNNHNAPETNWTNPADNKQTIRWPALEKLIKHGAQTGLLHVPAWGAYTMQTEMAFLSGIPPHAYGAHHINPYRAVAAHRPVHSLARALKKAGYRTLCLHPAKPGFFRRHRVMPHLGFDEFITLDSFKDAPRFGPYVSDESLGAYMSDLIEAAKEPLFIFAITIESHGPWPKGRLEDKALEAELCRHEPSGNSEFALYRAHMNNLLSMVYKLYNHPSQTAKSPKKNPEKNSEKNPEPSPKRAQVIALYGDHMPAHNALFRQYGFEDQAVDYILWHSQKGLGRQGPDLKTEDLGRALLNCAGFDIISPPTTQSKTAQSKTTQSKTTQSKTTQSKTTQSKTTQSKTEKAAQKADHTD